MVRVPLIACALSLAVPALAQQEAVSQAQCPPATADERVTLKWDAVELVRNQVEVEGSKTLWTKHGRYTYLFKDEANLAAFKADPSEFELQWDGACARMGPLSGDGSTKLPVVHAGKLYLCASSQCRETFQKHADRLLMTDDSRPSIDEVSRGRAKRKLDRAAEAMGPDGAIDSLATYREYTEGVADNRGTPVRKTKTLNVRFPDQFSEKDTWDMYSWGTVIAPAEAFQFSSSGPRDLTPAARRAFERYVDQRWLSALRGRNDPDAVIADAGEATVDGTKIALATVWRRGTSVTLGVDDEGLVRCARYRGRDSELFIADIEERYSDFRRAGVITAPYEIRVFADGVEQKDLAWKMTTVEGGAELDPDAFERPAGGT